MNEKLDKLWANSQEEIEMRIYLIKIVIDKHAKKLKHKYDKERITSTISTEIKNVNIFDRKKLESCLMNAYKYKNKLKCVETCGLVFNKDKIIKNYKIGIFDEYKPLRQKLCELKKMMKKVKTKIEFSKFQIDNIDNVDKEGKLIEMNKNDINLAILNAKKVNKEIIENMLDVGDEVHKIEEWTNRVSINRESLLICMISLERRLSQILDKVTSISIDMKWVEDLIEQFHKQEYFDVAMQYNLSQ